MAEQSEQRATQMWHQLTGSIFIHNAKKKKELLISRIIDQREKVVNEESLRMKAFTYGIKYSELLERMRR